METTKNTAIEAGQKSTTNLEYSFISTPTNVFYMLDMYCSRLLSILINKDNYWRNTSIKNNKQFDGYFSKSTNELVNEMGISIKEVRATIESLYRAKLINVEFGGNNHLTNKFKINYNLIKELDKQDLKDIMSNKVCSIKKLSRDCELTYKNNCAEGRVQMSPEVGYKCTGGRVQMSPGVGYKCTVQEGTNVLPTIDIAEDITKDKKTIENNYINNNNIIDNLKLIEEPTLKTTEKTISQPSFNSSFSFPKSFGKVKETEVSPIEAIKNELRDTDDPEEIYSIFEKWYSETAGTPSDKLYDFKSIFSTEQIISIGEYMRQEGVTGYNSIKRVINEVTVAMEEEEETEYDYEYQY